MSDHISPTRAALSESLSLAEEIVTCIELSQLPLSSVALKASRLARLLNDFEYQTIFEYEAGGYPVVDGSITAEVYRLAGLAGRQYSKADDGSVGSYIYASPIEQIEAIVSTGSAVIEAAKDPAVSISSANPNQFLHNPTGNTSERTNVRVGILTATKQLAERRGLLHRYANSKFYELKFSGIADDIFVRLRERVDGAISVLIPSEMKKLTAIYENLQSDNSEDWSNAVHGCRRLLQALADALFPPADDAIKIVNGKERRIKLGSDNYINRLVFYIEERSVSSRFISIVGSNMGFIGDRLDAVFQAAQKGSHAEIVERAEADRYVINTYLIVGDILTLGDKDPSSVSTAT